MVGNTLNLTEFWTLLVLVYYLWIYWNISWIWFARLFRNLTHSWFKEKMGYILTHHQKWIVGVKIQCSYTSELVSVKLYEYLPYYDFFKKTFVGVNNSIIFCFREIFYTSDPNKTDKNNRGLIIKLLLKSEFLTTFWQRQFCIDLLDLCIFVAKQKYLKIHFRVKVYFKDPYYFCRF